MKIQNVLNSQNKLIKLQLLKTKNYEKKNFFQNLKIEDIENRLKKGFKVLYKYNAVNKKLVFLNSCLTIELKLQNLLNKTEHIYISDYLQLINLMKNKKSFLLNKFQKKISRKTLNLRNKHNLIIVLNKQIKKKEIEKIPSIFVVNTLINFDIWPSYKIIGNFFYRKNQNFFFFVLLTSLFKKNIDKC